MGIFLKLESTTTVPGATTAPANSVVAAQPPTPITSNLAEKDADIPKLAGDETLFQQACRRVTPGRAGSACPRRLAVGEIALSHLLRRLLHEAPYLQGGEVAPLHLRRAGPRWRANA